MNAVSKILFSQSPLGEENLLFAKPKSKLGKLMTRDLHFFVILRRETVAGKVLDVSGQACFHHQGSTPWDHRHQTLCGEDLDIIIHYLSIEKEKILFFKAIIRH